MTTEPRAFFHYLVNELRAGRPSAALALARLLRICNRSPADYGVERSEIQTALQTLVQDWATADQLVSYEDKIAQMNQLGYSDAEIGLSPSARMDLDILTNLRDDALLTELRQAPPSEDNLLALSILLERIEHHRTTLAELGTTAAELQTYYTQVVRQVAQRAQALDPDALETWMSLMQGPSPAEISPLIPWPTPELAGLTPEAFARLAATTKQAVNSLMDAEKLIFEQAEGEDQD